MGTSAGSLIRLVILDDNRISREGLRRLIATDASLTVVGEGDSETVRSLIRHEAPDILLADVRADGTLPLCSDIRRGDTRPWVILMAAEADEEWAMRALEAGVRGVLTKGTGPEELLKAIRVVHDGQLWAAKRVVARLVQDLASRTGLSRAQQTLLAQRLSRREQEIARQAARGLSTKEIADRLAISPSTVKAHLARIFQKLGVRDRVQLSAFYHRAHPDPPE